MKTKKKYALGLLGGLAAAGATQVATTAHADTVTVKSGDTTWGIAQQNGTIVDQIVEDNHLANNGSLIYVGQTLAITKGTGANTTSGTTQAQQQTAATTTPAPSQTSGTPQYQSTGAQTSQGATNYTSNVAGNDAAAKAWIASRESGGNYGARNGQYIGKYQLSASYLGGDYSPAHQEQVADQYVAGRYGSWSNAQAFWQSHGWY